MFIDRHITSKKTWIIYVMQIIRYWAVGVLLLLNSITTFFKSGLVGLMFFLHARSSLSKHVEVGRSQVLRFGGHNTFLGGQDFCFYQNFKTNFC